MKEIKPSQDNSKNFIQETEIKLRDLELQIKELNNKNLDLVKSNDQLIKENEELKKNIEDKSSENKIINLIPIDGRKDAITEVKTMNEKKDIPNQNNDLAEEIKDNFNQQEDDKSPLVYIQQENDGTIKNENNQIVEDLPSPISQLYPSNHYPKDTTKLTNKIPGKKYDSLKSQWSKNEIEEKIKSIGESKFNQTYTESILNIQYHLKKNNTEIEKYTNYNKHIFINDKGEKIIRSSNFVDFIRGLNYYELTEADLICLIYKLSSANSDYKDILVNTLISEFKHKAK